MKKLWILTVIMSLAAGVASAQNYAFVNSQKVYQALPSYTAAVAELDSLASSYQKKIDAAYAELEKQYNNYLVVKNNLSADDQQSSEDKIIANEKKIGEYQQSVFGTDGVVVKKQEELLKPFTDNFNEAIKAFAEINSIDLVIDVASSPSILFYSPEKDKTEQIIIMLK